VYMESLLASVLGSKFVVFVYKLFKEHDPGHSDPTF
jgi:hypothetical protein